MRPIATPEPLERLGVRAGLNCTGTNTKFGGARVWPEVREAMEAVAPVNVDMFELNERAGRRLADLCGAEAGMVTSGASRRHASSGRRLHDRDEREQGPAAAGHRWYEGRDRHLQGTSHPLRPGVARFRRVAGGVRRHAQLRAVAA